MSTSVSPHLFWKASLSRQGLWLKEEWHSTGMLRRQQIMLALLFCVPNVLWVTLRHGGLSMVPSILTTWKHHGSLPDTRGPEPPSLTDIMCVKAFCKLLKLSPVMTKLLLSLPLDSALWKRSASGQRIRDLGTCPLGFLQGQGWRTGWCKTGQKAAWV